jgi:pyruvate dehydrogenase E1 component
VIWGSQWDDLLASDVDGVLLEKMNTTVDGDFQRYTTTDGAHIRRHFFGPDPRLGRLVEHLSDEDLRLLPRGGHDYRKLYAAYKWATEQRGAPTVILAKTVKGWTLGPDVEGRNATHQIKKMSTKQLMELRAPPPRGRTRGCVARWVDPPYPARRGLPSTATWSPAALDGAPPPHMRCSGPSLPDDAVHRTSAGSGGQSVSTTMAFTRSAEPPARRHFGPGSRPSSPTRPARSAWTRSGVQHHAA